MNTKRPVVLTIATICLVILVLFSSGMALTRNFGLQGSGLGAAGFPGSRFMNGGGQGNFPQGGFNNQQPGNNSGQLPGNVDPNNPNTQTNPNFQTFQGRARGTNGLFRVLSLVTTGLNIVIFVLGLLAAVGLWKQKKWAAVLAIILSAVLLLMSFTGLLRIFSWLIFGEALLKVLLALAVIVLLLLPAARKAYSPPPEPDLDF